MLEPRQLGLSDRYSTGTLTAADHTHHYCLVTESLDLRDWGGMNSSSASQTSGLFSLPNEVGCFPLVRAH